MSWICLPDGRTTRYDGAGERSHLEYGSVDMKRAQLSVPHPEPMSHPALFFDFFARGLDNHGECDNLDERRKKTYRRVFGLRALGEESTAEESHERSANFRGVYHRQCALLLSGENGGRVGLLVNRE